MTRRGISAVSVMSAGAAALGTAAVAFKVRDGTHPAADITVTALAGFLFIGAGFVAHLRRPENRVGILMVLVGGSYFLEDLQFSYTPAVFLAGLLLAQVSSGFVVHLVLAFPEGRLTSPRERLLTAAAYGAVLLLAPAGALFVDTRRTRADHKANPALVRDDLALADRILDVERTIAVVIAAGVVLILVRRWWTASPPRRRVLAPVFVTGLVGGVVTAGGLLVTDGPGHAVFRWTYNIAFCLLPLGFLLGVLRVHLGRTAVGNLLTELAEPQSPLELRALLARALGDPSLQIAYWRPVSGDFVDADGQVTTVPMGAGTGRTTRMVERAGRRVAALVHDAALHEDPHQLAAVTAAAALTLENQRLAAEVRAQLAEVRASRLRIVAAADAERRRLERDLHDGAQQRLVIAALSLRLARQRLDGTLDPATAQLLESSLGGLDAALGELRELARGIHPAILTEAGLIAAIRSLVERTPLAVEVTATEVPRLDPQVEATGYFVVAEALTNVLKHAGARQVHVGIEHGASRLRLEIVDDGRGGATVSGGTGLLGLRDRVSALGGELDVRDGPDGGTRVSAVLATG